MNPVPSRNGRRAGLAAGLVVAALAAAWTAWSPGEPASAVVAFAGEPAPASATAGSVIRAPRRLRETGLYLPDGSVDPRNRPFAPQYPLWTDGAAKSRWVRLPEGAHVDVSDLDAWRFPPGTTFWKEFAWAGRKVETRMIHLSADGEWSFATYLWTEDQTEAFLAPDHGVRTGIEVGPGKRHAIPGVADCLACHRSAPSVILGFNALQLSDDRDPLAPHAESLPAGAVTLRSLVAEDRLAPARPELASHPPRVRAGDPVARAAIGYLSGNCGHCHNARGPLARLGFSLLHEAAAAPGSLEPAHATAAGARSRFPLPGRAADSAYVLLPGDPERSAVVHRMRSRRASTQMPPLGTVIVDPVAVELVTRWIEGMGRRALP